MAKEIEGFIKLQIPGGQANPAPPVGPALGAKGVNIMQFCQAFNAATQDKMGTIVPVEITVYDEAATVEDTTAEVVAPAPSEEKGSPDTGVAGVASAVGAAVLAGAVMVAVKKSRK